MTKSDLRDTADRIRELHAKGARIAEIATETQVSRQYVHAVLGPAADRQREKPPKVAKPKPEPTEPRGVPGGRAMTPAKSEAARVNLAKARASVSFEAQCAVLVKARAVQAAKRKEKKDLSQNT